MSCKWNGSDQPRIITGRHNDDCHDEHCRGCQPCTEGHCRVCRMTHAEGTCAECLASTRSDLHEIARLCNSLPEEVEVRGIDGEAMMLLGPAADPEARGHLQASIACGRVPADYLESADHDQHPLFVLGTWDMCWRDALDHREVDALTLPGAVDYLDRQMTAMGANPHVPFEDFARDLRRCVSHLEGVLHDGEQVEQGAPCPECKKPLIRTYGKRAADDRWVCQTRSCDVRDYTTAQYQGWVEDDALRGAKSLTAAKMPRRFIDEDDNPRVKAGEVRVWGSRELVRKHGRDANGMTLYDVSDVERRLDERDEARRSA